MAVATDSDWDVSIEQAKEMTDDDLELLDAAVAST